MSHYLINMINIVNTNTFNIGDKVIVTGKPAYNNLSQYPVVPEQTIGHVIKIRHRYQNTPNEYFQYKVSFNGYSDGDDLTNLYSEYNIQLVKDD